MDDAGRWCPRPPPPSPHTSSVTLAKPLRRGLWLLVLQALQVKFQYRTDASLMKEQVPRPNDLPEVTRSRAGLSLTPCPGAR